MGALTWLVGVGRADGNVVTEAASAGTELLLDWRGVAMAEMGLVGGWLAGGWCSAGRMGSPGLGAGLAGQRVVPTAGLAWLAGSAWVGGWCQRLGRDCVSLAGRRQWWIVSLVDGAEEEGNKKEVGPTEFQNNAL
ncbi:hypothetical protein TIFTF001_029358 [Ficus carica]|uniref:Uncharacterized protein n=1 Tax=Ficus carica TaxID=3494 RepID=A0AA88J1F4_FICCA|nr:hypothetical protein TIFTF001_029358 [Ficus carica]